MTIWRFSVKEKEVSYGSRKRKLLTQKGCNEPFKDRFWCPKQEWFIKEPCPFINRRECENFSIMSGEKLARTQDCKARNKK
jgi:hypothetical protein